jgi:hypothetical protein
VGRLEGLRAERGRPGLAAVALSPGENLFQRGGYGTRTLE